MNPTKGGLQALKAQRCPALLDYWSPWRTRDDRGEIGSRLLWRISAKIVRIHNFFADNVPPGVVNLVNLLPIGCVKFRVAQKVLLVPTASNTQEKLRMLRRSAYKFVYGFLKGRI